MTPSKTSLTPVQRLLLVLFIISVVYQAGFSVGALNLLRDSRQIAREPLTFGFRLETVSGVTPEATAAGIKPGDVLRRVDGQPFTADIQIDPRIEKLKPGNPLQLDLTRPDGSAYSAVVTLAPVRERARKPVRHALGARRATCGRRPSTTARRCRLWSRGCAARHAREGSTFRESRSSLCSNPAISGL